MEWLDSGRTRIDPDRSRIAVKGDEVGVVGEENPTLTFASRKHTFSRSERTNFASAPNNLGAWSQRIFRVTHVRV
jgi:hypothetical protein